MTTNGAIHRLLVILFLGVTCHADTVGESTVAFGRALKDRWFLLNYTNLNHGSFGACPTVVLEYQYDLRRQQEQQPDVWMRQHYKQLLNATRQQLSLFLGLEEPQDQDGLVIVESASTAVNSILRSFPWTKGDILLYFSVAYAMVKNTAHWLALEYGITIVEVPITFPILEEHAQSAFLRPLQRTLQNLSDDDRKRLKMVVLDHMVSVPAVKEPVEELAAMIKSHQPHCFVLVDGAHTLGQVPNLNLSSAISQNIDAYLSNGHKWLYSPKGSAFLWLNPRSSTPVSASFPQPTVISSANDILGPTGLVQRYEYVSTRDYTAFLALSAALDFRRAIGGDPAIHHYCRTLALRAKHHLLQLWNVPAMAPDSLEEFMINIQLPPAIGTPAQGSALQEFLLQQHGIYMLVLRDVTCDCYYTRLSAQIYLEFEDFQTLGRLVLDFVNDIETMSVKEILS